MPDYSSAYDRGRTALIENLIPAGEGVALDVGCNTGQVTQMLAAKGYQAVGLDPDKEAIASGLQVYPGLDLRCGTLDDTAMSDCALITCLEVIEHLEPSVQTRLLAQIRRAIADNGTLVISTPGRYSLFSALDRVRRLLQGRRYYDWWDPSHVNVLSARRLHRLISAAGFRVNRAVGYYYLPQGIVSPFACSRWPLNNAGFDLIVVCTPRA